MMKKIFVTASALLALLLLGGLSACSKDSEPSDASGDSTQTTQAEPSEEKTGVVAEYGTSFHPVCQGDARITNAAAFDEDTRPYIVSAYYHNELSVGDSYSNAFLAYSEPFAAEEPESVNVVACLDEKPGTAEMAKTCDYDSDGTPVSVDFYSLTYEMTFYEAKTGKLIAKGEDIPGLAESCPSFVSYNPDDPKIYAEPHDDTLKAAVGSFAQ